MQKNKEPKRNPVNLIKDISVIRGCNPLHLHWLDHLKFSILFPILPKAFPGALKSVNFWSGLSDGPALHGTWNNLKKEGLLYFCADWGKFTNKRK